MICSLFGSVQRTTATSVLPNPSVNADPLRQALQGRATPVCTIVVARPYSTCLRGRRYLER
jgi:hypothetical protein